MFKNIVLSLITSLFFSTVVSAQRSLNDQFDDAFDELDSSVAFRFYDAVKGTPISNAIVTFEGETKQSNQSGKVNFDLPMDLPADTKLPILFRKNGYVSSKLMAHFMVGSLFNNHFSISPKLDLGKVRVVLDWGKKPSDLDAHLVKEGEFHVSYRHMKNYRERVWLDRDDRDGEGPETITLIRPKDNSIYSYFVFDYTNSGKLNQSQAMVHVYTSAGVSHSFELTPLQ